MWKVFLLKALVFERLDESQFAKTRALNINIVFHDPFFQCSHLLELSLCRLQSFVPWALGPAVEVLDGLATVVLCLLANP